MARSATPAPLPENVLNPDDLPVFIRPADTSVITKYEDTLSKEERKRLIIAVIAKILQDEIDERTASRAAENGKCRDQKT